MGQQNTIMNIHISGLDSGNKDNYKSQKEILNKLFPYEDLKKKTTDYNIKYCKDPKWNAFIYSDQNTNNFDLINQTIQNEINKYQKIKDKKEKNILRKKVQKIK